jgi:hypothetical protein
MPRTATVAYEEPHKHTKSCGCKHSYAQEVEEHVRRFGSQGALPADIVSRGEAAKMTPRETAVMIVTLEAVRKETVVVAAQERGKQYVIVTFLDRERDAIRGARILTAAGFKLEQQGDELRVEADSGEDRDRIRALLDAARLEPYVGRLYTSASEARDCATHGPPPEEIVVVAAEGPHSATVPEPPPAPHRFEVEPYKKPLRWHRGKKDGRYDAAAGNMGVFHIESRSPDRRHGKLPWVLTLGFREIAQGDTKSAVQAKAQRYARKPPMPSPEPACTSIVPQGDVDVIERHPACTPKVDIDTPKKLHAAMKDLVAKQGREVFWCVGKSTQGEMVGQPVQVAMGTVDAVHVEVADFVGAASRLRQAGAKSAYAVHCHPSGHGDNPSDMDRELTKKLRKGMDAISMPFDGHYVLTEKTWSRA